MSGCYFHSSKSLQKIFTDFNTYKMVGTKLLFTVAINTLAVTLLGGSKKQAILIGAASSLGSDLSHLTAHRISDELVPAVFILSMPIIGIACSYFASVPLLSFKALTYAVSPIIACFPTGYVMDNF